MLKKTLRISCLLLSLGLIGSGYGDIIVLEDFESGGLNGWATSGNAWTVGGTTGSTPNVFSIDASDLRERQ